MSKLQKEEVINIIVGSLVRQREVEPPNDRVREDRSGLTGIVMEIKATTGPLAKWSPLCAQVLWSDGLITEGYLVSALELA